MATQLLDHTTRALDAAPDRAEIHAVHALGLTLASPDDLAEARAAMQRAAELAPDDAFYQASHAFLAGAQQAPGTPPSPPTGPEPMLSGPSPEFFAEGNLLGSGDRGRRVKALHQRLACLRVPGFNDPGRYFDEYHEANAAGRGAVPGRQRAHTHRRRWRGHLERDRGGQRRVARLQRASAGPALPAPATCSPSTHRSTMHRPTTNRPTRNRLTSSPPTSPAVPPMGPPGSRWSI